MAYIIPPGGLLVDQSGPIVWGPPVPRRMTSDALHLTARSSGSWDMGTGPDVWEDAWKVWVGALGGFIRLDVHARSAMASRGGVRVYNETTSEVLATVQPLTTSSDVWLRFNLDNVGKNDVLSVQVFLNSYSMYVSELRVYSSSLDPVIIADPDLLGTSYTPSTTKSADANREQLPPERDIKNAASGGGGYLFTP